MKPGSLFDREHRVTREVFEAATEYRDASIRHQIEAVADHIRNANQTGKPIILAMGAHAVKNGIGPRIEHLFESHHFDHLATNGAALVHDFELAACGGTSEHVAKNLANGTFGCWRETWQFVEACLDLSESSNHNLGIGAAAGHILQQHHTYHQAIQYPETSLFGGIERNNGTATVHPQLGQDAYFQNPHLGWSEFGAAAATDWYDFVRTVADLDGGGVFISMGSDVMAPMIFEKAIACARGTGLCGLGSDFHIVVNDIKEGAWDWSNGEPPESHPAYYQRFNKTFSRVGATSHTYVQADNRAFINELIAELDR